MKKPDLSKITDAELLSEVQSRRSLKRKTFAAGPGRPKKFKTCPECLGEFGTVEIKKHQCAETRLAQSIEHLVAARMTEELG